MQAVDATDAARGRRAVVIISDGDDRYSETPGGTVVDRARRANVLIYPVALGRNRPGLFAELASVSGGRSFQVRDPRTLDATLSTIASELHEQYLLGYSPSHPFTSASRDEWRRITVRVKRAGVTVRARDGYYVR
jgi:Ca-activated chloride channel homolog